MTDEPKNAVSPTRDVSFISGPGLRLAARLYLPSPERDRKTGIVFCHGFGGVKEGTPVGLCDRLALEGYTALSFDYRGFGGSEGPRGHLVPHEQVQDAIHAVEFLSRDFGLHPDRLGIYGTSFGGGIALMACAQLPQIKSAFVTVPVVSGDHWLRSVCRYYEYLDIKQRAHAAVAQKAHTGQMPLVDRFDLVPPDPKSRERHVVAQQFTLETFLHVSHHEHLSVVDKIKIPVGVIGIKGDMLVPHEQTEWLYERLVGPKNLFFFPRGYHHSVYAELLDPVAERSIDWFNQHLGYQP